MNPSGGDPLQLFGKAAIVTGSSRGWGRGIAKALARRGVRVVVTGSNVGAVEAASAEIQAEGGKAVPIVADLSDRSGCQHLFDGAVEALGTIDILVNNAGKVEQGTILDTEWEDWRSVMALSLDAQFHMTQMVARHLVAAERGGRIINMAGGAAFSGLYGYASHAASKGGGMGAVLSWARELARYGITVNALAGRVDTEQAAPFLDLMRRTQVAEGKPAKTNRELGYYPPDELAAIVGWLASARAAKVTGRMIHASGPELQVWRMATIEATFFKAGGDWSPELIDDMGLQDLLESGHGLEPRRAREPIVVVPR